MSVCFISLNEGSCKDIKAVNKYNLCFFSVKLLSVGQGSPLVPSISPHSGPSLSPLSICWSVFLFNFKPLWLLCSFPVPCACGVTAKGEKQHIHHDWGDHWSPHSLPADNNDLVWFTVCHKLCTLIYYNERHTPRTFYAVIYKNLTHQPKSQVTERREIYQNHCWGCMLGLPEMVWSGGAERGENLGEEMHEIVRRVKEG